MLVSERKEKKWKRAIEVIKTFKSSHRRCSVRNDVLKNFNIHRKTPVLEFFLNKVTGLKACNFIFENRLQHRCFPVNIANFLKTTFFEEPLQTTTSRP